jgi:hypothetical protein
MSDYCNRCQWPSFQPATGRMISHRCHGNGLRPCVCHRLVQGISSSNNIIKTTPLPGAFDVKYLTGLIELRIGNAAYVVLWWPWEMYLKKKSLSKCLTDLSWFQFEIAKLAEFVDIYSVRYDKIHHRHAHFACKEQGCPSLICGFAILTLCFGIL